MKEPTSNTNERGVAVTEYAVMLVLVALGVAFFGPEIQEAVTDTFQTVITFLS